uniref:Uncharacterized protein n=1 Tax=Hyaloperonospora arabidopsidis (strain Emoy2) TaxID=559515 RepID=M4BP51_HYAAE
MTTTFIRQLHWSMVFSCSGRVLLVTYESGLAFYGAHLRCVCGLGVSGTNLCALLVEEYRLGLAAKLQ